MSKRKTISEPLSIRIDKDLAERLDLLAKELSYTRSRLAATIIEYAIPELKVMDKTGLMKLGAWFQDIMDRHRIRSSEGQGKNITVGIWLNKDAVERLDYYAEKIGITRSKLASNILIANLPEISFFTKLGVTKILFWLDGLKTEEKDGN